MADCVNKIILARQMMEDCEHVLLSNKLTCTPGLDVCEGLGLKCVIYMYRAECPEVSDHLEARWYNYACAVFDEIETEVEPTTEKAAKTEATTAVETRTTKAVEKEVTSGVKNEGKTTTTKAPKKEAPTVAETGTENKIEIDAKSKVETKVENRVVSTTEKVIVIEAKTEAENVVENSANSLSFLFVFACCNFVLLMLY